MALATSSNVSLRLGEASNRPCIVPPPRSVATFARRGNRTTAITSKRRQESLKRDVIKEVEADSDWVDPFEVLFGMLEEDLKNLDEELLGTDDDEDISFEELAKLEKELETAIGEGDELLQLLSVGDGDVIDVGPGGVNVGGDDGEGDVELELKDWQLKKLADAAKSGRRRTNIKSLAAELGLDMDLVMDMLRIPSEELLSMGTNSSSPRQDHKRPVVLEAEYEVLEDASDEASKVEAKSEVTINATQTRQSSRKSCKNVLL